jgi:hypothetical protein
MFVYLLEVADRDLSKRILSKNTNFADLEIHKITRGDAVYGC